MLGLGIRAVMAICASVALTAMALAQETYPSRQITLVVPYAAGGPSDSIARLVGELMGARLGQTFVIENVAGAGGTTGAARVAKAEADGYTLLIHHLALAAGASLYPKLAYDTTTAFAGIGLVNSGPFVLTGKKGLAANTAKEALDYIRANKDKVTMGSAGARLGLQPLQHADPVYSGPENLGGCLSRHGARHERSRGRADRFPVRPVHQRHVADQGRHHQGIRGHLH